MATRLFSPAVERIGHPGGDPHPDRAPDAVAAGTPEPLRSELTALLGPERVLVRPSALTGPPPAAAPSRLIRRVVVMAHDPGDIARVFASPRRTGMPVVLRGGGTSLNGQGQTDGIL